MKTAYQGRAVSSGPVICNSSGACSCVYRSTHLCSPHNTAILAGVRYTETVTTLTTAAREAVRYHGNTQPSVYPAVASLGTIFVDGGKTNKILSHIVSQMLVI